MNKETRNNVTAFWSLVGFSIILVCIILLCSKTNEEPIKEYTRTHKAYDDSGYYRITTKLSIDSIRVIYPYTIKRNKDD